MFSNIFVATRAKVEIHGCQIPAKESPFERWTIPRFTGKIKFLELSDMLLHGHKMAAAISEIMSSFKSRKV